MTYEEALKILITNNCIKCTHIPPHSIIPLEERCTVCEIPLMAKSLIKQIPKRSYEIFCPVCLGSQPVNNKMNYCPKCGQALDWSGKK